MTTFIGDVHGQYKEYYSLIKKFPNSIQVGDLGVGFFHSNGKPCPNPSEDIMKQTHARFIRGNHDNPNFCKTHPQWIPDGHVEDETMFIGGAISVDKAIRTEFYNYWADEELSHKEWDALLNKYLEVLPKILVTHECPQSVADDLFHYPTVYPSITGNALDSFFFFHKPQIWIFGHHHAHRDRVIDGVRFICLAELEHISL